MVNNDLFQEEEAFFANARKGWVTIEVPPGHRVGRSVHITLDDGSQLEVEVPEGIGIGEQFETFIGEQQGAPDGDQLQVR
eukprot:COSAG05_NODE_2045_length_3644_cov_3.395487_2_plen_80_part_00